MSEKTELAYLAGIYAGALEQIDMLISEKVALEGELAEAKADINKITTQFANSTQEWAAENERLEGHPAKGGFRMKKIKLQHGM